MRYVVGDISRQQQAGMLRQEAAEAERAAIDRMIVLGLLSLDAACSITHRALGRIYLRLQRPHRGHFSHAAGPATGFAVFVNPFGF